MPEFLELIPPQVALNTLLKLYDPPREEEIIASDSALERIASSPVAAPHPLPSFSKSTVDGYAVIASDTYGASETLPGYLKVIGEVPMGDVPDFSLSSAVCAVIHTGGMLPGGADAVLMLEFAQQVQENEIEFYRSAAYGENVINVGEDVKPGQEVISTGSRLRPAEIGGLMALGITQVEVYRKPKVGIISSGDEVITPDIELPPGKVRDINSYTLAALVESAGGVGIRYGIVPDQIDSMIASVTTALDECDLVVVTAGSSASSRDHTAQVINQLGPPGVLVHGVNIKPGKPTILGLCAEKPVIGLPGNPVSALVIASLFVVPVVEVYLGLNRSLPRPSLTAQLTTNLASIAGREDWIAVRIVTDETISSRHFLAEPIYGKSNLIFTLARADGLIRIPADATGLDAGDIVEVIIL